MSGRSDLLKCVLTSDRTSKCRYETLCLRACTGVKKVSCGKFLKNYTIMHISDPISEIGGET